MSRRPRPALRYPARTLGQRQTCSKGYRFASRALAFNAIARPGAVNRPMTHVPEEPCELCDGWHHITV